MHKIYSFIQKAAKVTFAFGFCVMSAFALASCGDDDDDNNPPGGNGGNDSENTGGNTGGGSEVVAPSGLRPVSIGQYVFSYDSKNRCTEISGIYYDGSGATVKIDYAKGRFSYGGSYTYGEKSYENYSETGPCTFTKEGYIASMKLTVKEETYDEYDDDYSSVNREDSYTFGYDKEGHLNSVTVTSKGNIVEYGNKFNVSGTTKIVLTWNDGNLMKSEGLFEGSWGGEKVREKITDTYRYGDQANRFGQPTYAMSRPFEAWCSYSEQLVLAGLLGKGTAMLPDYLTILDSEDEEEFGQDCQYDLNQDGSIRNEYHSGQSFYYVYPGENGKTLSGRTVYSERVKKAPRSFFSKHRFGVR